MPEGFFPRASRVEGRRVLNRRYVFPYKKSCESDGQSRLTFTVFTPTYNRKDTLSRVYESLKNQTYESFEWVVIDDGSTDDTPQLVEEWCRQATVKIRYEYQLNQGKHAAYNRAVDLAEGEFFLPLDSDDACVPTALERFKSHWDSIPPQIRTQFSGVCALCMDQHGNIVGDRFPSDIFDSNSLELTFCHGVKGEKWGFHRTHHMRRFRFPVLENASFIPESLLWFALARHFQERYVNEPLRIYWIEPSSTTQQLTARFDVNKHGAGRYLYYKTMLNEYPDWACRAPWLFARIAANYVRMAFHLGYGWCRQVSDIQPAISKLLWVVSIPVGLVLYVKDRIDY